MNELIGLKQSAETWCKAVKDSPQAIQIVMALDAIQGLVDYITQPANSEFYTKYKQLCVDLTDQIEMKTLRMTLSNEIKDKMANIRKSLEKEVSAAKEIPGRVPKTNQSKRSCGNTLEAVAVGVTVLCVGFLFYYY